MLETVQGIRGREYWERQGWGWGGGWGERDEAVTHRDLHMVGALTILLVQNLKVVPEGGRQAGRRRQKTGFSSAGPLGPPLPPTSSLVLLSLPKSLPFNYPHLPLTAGLGFLSARARYKWFTSQLGDPVKQYSELGLGEPLLHASTILCFDAHSLAVRRRHHPL